MTTPEYLPPEMLKGGKDVLPWAIDTWSLGIVLLEMVLIYPVYMAYKGRVTRHGTDSSLTTGLLGDTGRQPAKILKL